MVKPSSRNLSFASGRRQSGSSHRSFKSVIQGFETPLPHQDCPCRLVWLRMPPSHGEDTSSNLVGGTNSLSSSNRIGLRFPKPITTVRICATAPYCACSSAGQSAVVRRRRPQVRLLLRAPSLQWRKHRDQSPALASIEVTATAIQFCSGRQAAKTSGLHPDTEGSSPSRGTKFGDVAQSVRAHP